MSRQKPKRRRVVKPPRRNSTPPAPQTSDKKKIALLTRERDEALKQQAAAREILRVISSSPTDIQPIFDMIARSAVRLTDGLLSGVYRFDGGLIDCVAHYNWTAEGLASLRRVYPRPLSRETQVATAILDRRIVHVPDFDDPGVPPQSLTLVV
jgi:hypothetical protein